MSETDSSPNELTLAFQKIMDSLSLLKMNISNIQQEVRFLEKRVKKDMKSVAKEAKQNKPRGPRKPSGFAKPSNISDELCEFLNLPIGSQIARTDVTRELVAYIKQHNLAVSAPNKKKQVIKPDAKLLTLLSDVSNEEELTYFTLQKHMNHHFQSSTNTNE